MRKCLILLVVPAMLFGGTTGLIKGRVVDAETGDPLPYANVVIAELKRGTSTMEDGTFFIAHVPAGTYTVTASMIGYAPTTFKNVVVYPDRTVELNFFLKSGVIQTEPIVVEATRIELQKDAPQTVRAFSGEDVQNLPVRDAGDIIAMAAGVAIGAGGIHIRGGRENEVAYYVDGISVKNPLYGNLGANINRNAIKEMVVLAGAFSAEYGNAMSGVVNVITAEGGPKFKSIANYRTSNTLVRPILSTNPLNLRLTKYDGYKHDEFEFSAGGPLTKFLRYYLSFYNLNRGSFYIVPEPPAGYTSSYGFDYRKEMSLQSKITILPTRNLKINISGFWNNEEWKPYAHRYLLISESYGRRERIGRQLVINVNHLVNEKVMYTISAGGFARKYVRKVWLDSLERYKLPNEYVQPMTDQKGEFYISGDDYIWHEDSSLTLNAKGDLSIQLDKKNNIKTGFDAKIHHLYLYNIEYPWRAHPYTDIYMVYPREGGFYLQHKYEGDIFVTNVGVRFDYFDPHVDYVKDPYDTTKTYKATPKYQISPRIGVSYPWTENSLFYFSFGRFFQMTDYYYLYENLARDLLVRYPIMGNPDLEPQRTTAFEVGFQHMIDQRTRFTLTAYYKDIRNLVGTRLIPEGPGTPIAYTIYKNSDYANVKGIEFELYSSSIKNLTYSIQYSYSRALGNASDEWEGYMNVISNISELDQFYPLDFDQPHKLSGYVSYYLERIDATISTSLEYSSGFPYTPVDREGYRGAKNSARMPSRFYFNLRGYKNFRLGPARFGLEFEVQNLLNTRNVLYVYPVTGSPDYSGLGRSSSYDKDPSNFGAPRRIFVGIRGEL
ncbi:MAG: TonB-dependent receptor [candidate division WOR-3 bacterium]